MSDREERVGHWIRLDGEYLDIPSGDVSEYDAEIKRLVQGGGGWFQTQNGITPGMDRHWVGPSSAITVHYSE
jgi:hypothetical protein